MLSRIFQLSLLSFLATILLIASITMFQYSRWEETFENNMVEEYLSSNTKELPEEIQMRVAMFVLSEESTDFMEFTVSEFSSILDYVLNLNIKGLSFEKIYIQPSDGLWRIYTKAKLVDTNLPWVSIDVQKDDIESAEFYIQNIYIGKTALPKTIFGKILELANQGISEAVLLFNENLFSKRYLQNISLMEEKIVIKGVVY